MKNSYLKLIVYEGLELFTLNCVQTNEYYKIEIINWNHIILIIR